jgi:hypothetical protein
VRLRRAVGGMVAPSPRQRAKAPEEVDVFPNVQRFVIATRFCGAAPIGLPAAAVACVGPSADLLQAELEYAEDVPLVGVHWAADAAAKRQPSRQHSVYE